MKSLDEIRKEIADCDAEFQATVEMFENAKPARAAGFRTPAVKPAQATGPRTDAGKAVSSRNSLHHGLTAKRIVLSDEDPAEFDRLLTDLAADRKPVGELGAMKPTTSIAATRRSKAARPNNSISCSATPVPSNGNSTAPSSVSSRSSPRAARPKRANPSPYLNPL
jgi:hypothetical protein